MSRFEGKVAIVTGAAQGIGAAIARRLANEGARVAVVDLTADRAQGTVDQIVKDGGEAFAVGADVSKTADVQAAVAAVVEEFGRIDILVNNAGITRDDLVASLGEEEWAQVLDTDLTAAFRFTRRALRGMLRARTGRIVNVASIAGLRANPGQANYSAAKAGLISLTKTAAVEVARRGVTINAVAPGLIQTDMTAELSPDLAGLIPARRMGTPEEVAACVRFLTSEQASYVTGAVLTVDGGLAA
jgi:3-oxoacyl-[acyl-carrier protein] reductase